MKNLRFSVSSANNGWIVGLYINALEFALRIAPDFSTAMREMEDMLREYENSQVKNQPPLEN